MSTEDKNKFFDPTDENPDPISGQPGAHPIGTGIGAAGAGAAGAAIGGVVGGPVGAVVGAAVGSVVGGLIGKGAAESINPTVEDNYWRENYSSRPYVQKDESYDVYQPAYRSGYEGYGQYASSGRTFDDVEPDLRQDYETRHGNTGLGWDKAKHAARDAWEKVKEAVPGDQGGEHDRVYDRADAADAANVKLYEERLVADKHRNKVGEVAIGKHVETETSHVSVPVEKERVVIERVNSMDAGRSVMPGDVNFGDAEVARVEVYEETPDIHKEAFVREEVTVKKVVDRDVVDVEDEVRRERLELDQHGKNIVDRRD